MKEPYLRHLKTIDGCDVWVVDGDFIRREWDGQFTDFAQHSDFPFVPKNELWLDRCNGENEFAYYIANMLAQRKALQEGKSPKEAYSEGDKAEAEARRTEHKRPIKIKKIESYANVDVYLIDGAMVRKKYDLEFTEGGHDLVYPWIKPRKGRGEIWLDDSSTSKDRPYQQLHEMHERNKMSLKMDYGHGSRCTGAHASASHEEREARHNPALLKSLMEREREIARIIYEEGTGEKARKHIVELNKNWNTAIRFDYFAHNKKRGRKVKKGHTRSTDKSFGSLR
jgi:hypothetical protein